ncbi:hypothetical protein BUZ08_09565, partial [Staphylococcus gallinarum]
MNGEINKFIKYNINGIGIIEPSFYENAETLLNYKELEIIERLHKVKQLGTISGIHKGANFTRYEYILLQIELLNIVAKESSIGLKSKLNKEFFGENEELRDSFSDMTRVDCIQVMTILGNMGHFTGTHSSNKVWFNII